MFSDITILTRNAQHCWRLRRVRSHWSLVMRKVVHDNRVYFRAPTAVVEKAEQHARAEGMSLSEFVRAAVRAQIARAA